MAFSTQIYFGEFALYYGIFLNKTIFIIFILREMYIAPNILIGTKGYLQLAGFL